MQQPIAQLGTGYLDTVGEDEAALELTSRNTAMQENAFLIIGLLAADHQLVVLQGDGEIGSGEARDSQRDTQSIFGNLLDIVRGITLGSGFGGAFDQTFHVIEAKQKRTGE